MTYPQSYRLDSAMGGYFIATTITSLGPTAVFVSALAGEVGAPREPALIITVTP